MLLFTWTGVVTTIQQMFEWCFRLMEVPNRNVNIVFIVIGAAGILFWLRMQAQYNKAAEKNGTIK